MGASAREVNARSERSERYDIRNTSRPGHRLRQRSRGGQNSLKGEQSDTLASK